MINLKPNLKDEAIVELTTLTLTKQQTERRNSLIHFDGIDHANDIVNNLGRSGTNSWQSVQNKLGLLYQAPFEQREYYDALYNEFDLDTVYKIEQIGEMVPTLRASISMQPFRDNIEFQSVRDFLNLFIVETIYDREVNPKSNKVIGYKPILKLKA